MNLTAANYEPQKETHPKSNKSSMRIRGRNINNRTHSMDNTKARQYMITPIKISLFKMNNLKE